jgi:hypothetical protein
VANEHFEIVRLPVRKEVRTMRLEVLSAMMGKIGRLSPSP